MFEPITIPFGAKMLFNTVKLKPGVAMDDVELAIGEMCNVVKNTYGGDKGGFVGGQVFVKGTDIMSVQVVLHDPDFERLRILGGQGLEKKRVLAFSALRVNLGQASAPGIIGDSAAIIWQPLQTPSASVS